MLQTMTNTASSSPGWSPSGPDGPSRTWRCGRWRARSRVSPATIEWSTEISLDEYLDRFEQSLELLEQGLPL